MLATCRRGRIEPTGLIGTTDAQLVHARAHRWRPRAQPADRNVTTPARLCEPGSSRYGHTCGGLGEPHLEGQAVDPGVPNHSLAGPKEPCHSSGGVANVSGLDGGREALKKLRKFRPPDMPLTATDGGKRPRTHVHADLRK